jgi:hypothetical protein
MKHIKKFNESYETKLDIEYIEHCFREVMEDVDFRFESMDIYKGVQFSISTWLEKSIGFDINKPFNHWSYNPVEIRNVDDTEVTDFFENWVRMSKKVDVSIKRLLDEYPEYEVNKILCKSPTLRINIVLM